MQKLCFVLALQLPVYDSRREGSDWLMVAFISPHFFSLEERPPGLTVTGICSVYATSHSLRH